MKTEKSLIINSNCTQRSAIFKRKLGVGLAAGLFLFSAASMAQATYIVGAQGATASRGDQGPDYVLGNVIDQSGLSANYNNGDDFDSFVATVTHEWEPEANEWWTPWDTTDGEVIFDLGRHYTLDKIGLWNEDAAGIESMAIRVSDQMFSGTNAGTLVGIFSVANGDITDNYYDFPNSRDYNADVLSFNPVTSVRYVLFDMIAAEEDPPQGDPATGLYTLSMAEVVFSVAEPVPEPATMFLFATGLLGLAAVRRSVK